jgi:outer membrane protein insertion porin family
VPDQVDLEVNLVEKSTGNFLLGVGYSSSDGILLRGSVSQRNLFGTGREVSFSANTSDSVTRYDLSFRNPYYTTSGISRGFRLNKREVDSSEADTAEYILDSVGGGVFYGFPLSEFITLNAGFDYERIELEETVETPPEFSSFINEFPESDLYKLTSSIAHDTRDSLTWPTNGGVVSFSLEAAVPGSDLEYYKTNLRSAYYQPLFTDNFVFKLGGSVGYGDGYSDTPELPFFENFFAGGPTTVRGFESRSLGPKDTGDTPEPIGGAKRILATAELLFPFPGAVETRDKRLGLFVDAGQVYNQSDSFDTGEIRYSSGLSFRWISPVGPIVMSYGIPLNDEEDDEEENFQLTLGVNLD